MTEADTHFADWKRREALAEAMIPMIGTLHRERDVTILVHSRSLVNKSVISILKTHRYVRQIEKRELAIEETFPILQVLSTLDLGPSRIDIGKLAIAYAEQAGELSVEEFTRRASRAPRGRTRWSAKDPPTSFSTASAASAGCSRGC